MLTTKNSGLKLAFGEVSTICLAVLLFFIAGCQPSGPRSLLLGDKYVTQGDYGKALKYLTRAAQLMPERPEVWNLIGLSFHGMQQRPQAVEAYQRALRIDRSFAAAHYNLGVLFLEQQRLPDAIAELNTYTSMQPDKSVGWAKLSTALTRARRPDDAERACHQALRVNPKDAEALNNLAIAHIQRKRPREAVQALNSALQAHPGYGPVLLNQAVVAQEYFGNKAFALERYKAYLATKPEAKPAVEVRRAIEQIERDLAGARIAANPPEVHTNAVLKTNFPSLAETRSNENRTLPLHTNMASGPTSGTSPKTNALVAVPPTNSFVLPKTNVIAAAKTNTPAAEVTNKVMDAELPKTNAAPVESEPEPPIQVEVVKVEQEPDFKAPKDIAPLTSAPPAAATNKALAMNNAAAPEEKPLIAPRKERKEEEKSGLLDRMNPAHWFKKDDGKATPTTPASRSSYRPVYSEPRSTPVTSSPSVGTAPAPQPPPRVIPRYPYRKDLSLARGNRTQAEKMFADATAAYQQKRAALAVELYKQAVAADPSYFDAQYNLGLVAYQSKELPLALAADEQAVALKPHSADARYNFALALRDANYATDAGEQLRQLLAQTPNDLRAHLALANLYVQDLDEPALARKHYQRVLELAPNHPEAASIRQWLASTP